ncbi:E3 ubiquitin-protein ligase TRIM39-like protein, partial [Lates japonicus]
MAQISMTTPFQPLNRRRQDDQRLAQGWRSGIRGWLPLSESSYRREKRKTTTLLLQPADSPHTE